MMVEAKQGKKTHTKKERRTMYSNSTTRYIRGREAAAMEFAAVRPALETLVGHFIKKSSHLLTRRHSSQGGFSKWTRCWFLQESSAGTGGCWWWWSTSRRRSILSIRVTSSTLSGTLIDRLPVQRTFQSSTSHLPSSTEFCTLIEWWTEQHTKLPFFQDKLKLS